MMTTSIPRHVAIVMDGNGRWAKQRGLPRIAGHRAGVEAVRAVIEAAIESGVEVLSLFAFSSENWQRPSHEVSYLMKLFLRALKSEIKKLHQHDVQVRVIGDRSRFSSQLLQHIHDAETLTAANTRLKLILAVNYGGQWDIVQAVRQLVAEAIAQPQAFATIEKEMIAARLVLADIPDPDLFIRTSGEYRVSNFFLWQLAYAELYFTSTFWPDFRKAEFLEALGYYGARQRRFGRTSEQMEELCLKHAY